MKELEEEYEVIEKSITNYTEKNNKIILVGDFNGKVGNDENGITNGETSITTNGKRIRSMVRTLNLGILNRHAKFEEKWTRVNTKNSNEKSIIDYAICSKTLSKDFIKVLIDHQETYKIKGKNKSDHNTFIIDIEKTVNNNKIHPKHSWKINNNTNWSTYKNVIENEIEYNPPGNYQELEQIVHSTAMKTIGMCKYNSNQIYDNKNIKTSTKVRQQKYTAKKELQQAIIIKNNIEIKLKNSQYIIS